MQIVIDISEDDLDAIKFLKVKGWASRHELLILNGTPLKNITNEINNLASSPNAISAWYRIAIKDCLRVIDKYRKESE